MPWNLASGGSTGFRTSEGGRDADASTALPRPKPTWTHAARKEEERRVALKACRMCIAAGGGAARGVDKIPSQKVLRKRGVWAYEGGRTEELRQALLRPNTGCGGQPMLDVQIRIFAVQGKRPK